MTDGASPSVHRTVELLTRSPDDAFLTPIPQYPLYSASLAMHGAHLLPYYLDEASDWGMDPEHLRSQCVAVSAAPSWLPWLIPEPVKVATSCIVSSA